MIIELCSGSVPSPFHAKTGFRVRSLAKSSVVCFGFHVHEVAMDPIVVMCKVLSFGRNPCTWNCRVCCSELRVHCRYGKALFMAAVCGASYGWAERSSGTLDRKRACVLVDPDVIMHACAYLTSYTYTTKRQASCS